MILCDYQQRLENLTFEAWNNKKKNIMVTLATGGGKTVIISSIVEKMRDANPSKYIFCIAHRQELVSQISVSLAYNGLKHTVYTNNNSLRKFCSWLHIDETGSNYSLPNQKIIVIGIKTLLTNVDKLSPFIDGTCLWVLDEGHHLLEDNEWGKGIKHFKNALGLAMTATAGRGDGRGLGRHADGLIDHLVEGPQAYHLINEGWLTPVKIICPINTLDKFNSIVQNVEISKKTGDYVQKQLRDAFEQAEITGDVVDKYLEHIPGKKTIVFVTHKEIGAKICAKFLERGVPAEFLHSKTPDNIRNEAKNRLKSGKTLVLINVALFGEGFDLPAVEAVVFARHTDSLSFYLQMCGRAMRLMLEINRAELNKMNAIERMECIAQSEKPFGFILDLVGNVLRHRGGPDKIRNWSLDSREKRYNTEIEGEPQRICGGCSNPYDRILLSCPHCGWVPKVKERSHPSFVDGDLTELDEITLALIKGDIDKIHMDVEDLRNELIRRNVPHLGQLRLIRLHKERQKAQDTLRLVIRWWAAAYEPSVNDVRELYKMFYFKFGQDILTAQTLNTKEALALADKISFDMTNVSKTA